MENLAYRLSQLFSPMNYADTIGLAGLVVLIANLVVFYFVLRQTRGQSVPRPTISLDRDLRNYNTGGSR